MNSGEPRLLCSLRVGCFSLQQGQMPATCASNTTARRALSVQLQRLPDPQHFRQSIPLTPLITTPKACFRTCWHEEYAAAPSCHMLPLWGLRMGVAAAKQSGSNGGIQHDEGSGAATRTSRHAVAKGWILTKSRCGEVTNVDDSSTE